MTNVINVFRVFICVYILNIGMIIENIEGYINGTYRVSIEVHVDRF